MAELVEPSFPAVVAGRFGERGREWLAALPQALEELARRWELELGPPLAGGPLACVHAVTRKNGHPSVLKLGGPWSRTADEAAALRAWQGVAAPALLLADEERGALLLERIEPGARPDRTSAAEVARVLHALHVSPPTGLPALAELVRQRVETAVTEGRAPQRKAAWALARIDELELDPPPPVLLHGDFDERNLLLCARRGLAAIGPLPCAGDPAYDAASWIHGNRRPGRRARFLTLVGELDLDRERVRGWSAVVGVHG